MATIQMKNKCLAFIENMQAKLTEHNLSCDFDFDGTLKFFGIVVFIDESELPKLSKTMQCRHEREDLLLRALYPECEAYFERIIVKDRAVQTTH